ncbi:unnamed protein product [Hymenolepis diminuta]|uniref:FYVE-type domain-containing protein n=1 Tax=Hymenolepis diminuta TaxID=6216 RepID=A0A0R3SKT3_HYMDI|nr:unnamed protein product [Hymenolepis diminuta]
MDNFSSQGNLPPPVVVQRGSKVFQRLPTLPDTLPVSSGSAGAAVSATNAQATNSLGRAKDEFFGGVTRRGRLGTDRPFPSVHHNRTSGDLFGAVSSFFTRTGGSGAAGTSSGGGGDIDVCEICHVTKFTSTAGHNCAQCNLKTCVRCGGWFGTQPSWMCKNCFSNLSAPPKSVAGGVKDVQRPTAGRSLATTDQSATTGEILPHSRHNPVSSVAPTSSARPHPAPPTSSSSSAIGNVFNVPPSVERSQSGYAGVASRSRLREAMRE